MADTPQTVIVNTKSAWLSKTNWAAAATGLGVIITQFLPFIPQDYQGKVTALVALLGAVATWITRTFYTTSLTPSSTSALPTAASAIRTLGATEQQITDVLNAAQLPSK